MPSKIVSTKDRERRRHDQRPWQTSVLACVGALDQLQLTLSCALAGQGQIGWREPKSPLPALPILDALPQRLDYDLNSDGTERRFAKCAS